MVAAKKSKTPHFPVLESGSRGRKRRKNERKEVAVGLLKVLKDKSMKGGSMLIGLV